MTEVPSLWFTVWNDDSDDPPTEPELPEVPAAFLYRLREMIPTWRRLGRTDWNTGGAFEKGRLRVDVSVSSPELKTAFGYLRVEISNTEWMADWTTMELTTPWEDAGAIGLLDPAGGPITDPDQAVDEASGWLAEQLSRPTAYREWRHGDKVLARSLRLEDTGDLMFVDGPESFWRKLDLAAEVVRRRLGGEPIDGP